MLLSQEGGGDWMEHFCAAKRRIAWPGLVLLSGFGAICIVAAPMAAAPRGAFPRQAQAEDSPERSRGEALSFGKQQRTKRNEITVSLEFASSEQQLPNRIRAEIEFGEGPWRFEKAEAPPGSSLKIAVKQRGEERENPPDGIGRFTVLSVELAAGKGTIPAGSAGELVFSLQPPESVETIPLVLREWEVSRAAEQAPQHPPMLEMPSGEPGMNPSAGCFFFTH